MDIRFARGFLRHVYRNHGGFITTWPLGRDIELGEIVKIQANRQQRLSKIDEAPLNINFNASTDNSPSDISWSKTSATSISLKAAGETLPNSALPQAKAGISIEFKKEGAFLFEPKGIKFKRVRDYLEIKKQVKEKLSRGMINFRKIMLVNEVAEVDSYALVISASREAKIELSAEVEIKGTADLADTSIDFTFNKVQQLEYHNIGGEGGSLFFKGDRIRVRKDARLLLVNENPRMEDLTDENLAELIPAIKSVDENNFDEYYEFSEASLDDLESLIGFED